MDREGPLLESLTRRLAEIPADFLAEPRIGNTGAVHVAAVVQDLLVELSGPVGHELLESFAGKDPKRDRARLAVTLVLCWLLADEWFRAVGLPASSLLELLTKIPAELAGRVGPKKIVTDAERREELARLSLARLGRRPAGETKEQAEDRLTCISSAERERVLAASRAAEERARLIRKALIKKAAEESADKWTRE